jgi:hypothetical protein
MSGLRAVVYHRVSTLDQDVGGARQCASLTA